MGAVPLRFIASVVPTAGPKSKSAPLRLHRIPDSRIGGTLLGELWPAHELLEGEQEGGVGGDYAVIDEYYSPIACYLSRHARVAARFAAVGPASLDENLMLAFHFSKTPWIETEDSTPNLILLSVGVTS